MAYRAEVTTKFARQYARAAKKDKGLVLDQVVAVTGWSRDNARRRLTAAAKAPPGRGRSAAQKARKPRAPKYSYDALKVLQRVWAASGFQCGKYLTVSMPLLLDLLESADHLEPGAGDYGPGVRGELESMSAATIDRYLQPVKARAQLKGKSTTKAGPLLRNSIRVCKAGDEVEAEPGFFEVDTVAHCGPVLKGEFARTVNLTEVSNHLCKGPVDQPFCRVVREGVGWGTGRRKRSTLDAIPGCRCRALHHGGFRCSGCPDRPA